MSESRVSERRVSDQEVTSIRKAEAQAWLRRRLRFERLMAAWHGSPRRKAGGRGVAA